MKSIVHNIETLDEEPKELNNITFSEHISLNTTGLSINKEDLDSLEKQKDLLCDDKVYGVNVRIKKPRRMGNVFTLLYFKSQPLIVIGPDYALTLCLYACINIVNALLFKFIYSELPTLFYYLGLIIYLSQTISHIITAIINPGIPSRECYINNHAQNNQNNLKNGKSGYKMCKICNIIVHDRKNACHCEDCNICVEDHDHHCAWSGKCIGRINLYPFYVFVFSTLLFIIFTFLSIMIYLVTYADRMKNKKDF